MHVLVMAEYHATGRTILPAPFVELPLGFGYRWVLASGQVVPAAHAERGRLSRRTRPGPVTDAAIRFINPVPVAIHALLMIRALQPRLVNIGPPRSDLVAGATRGWRLSVGRTMMTGRATSGHRGHLGVPFVVERHGQVRSFDGIHNDHVRSRRDRAVCRAIAGLIALAWMKQTSVFRCRGVAVMALPAARPPHVSPRNRDLNFGSRRCIGRQLPWRSGRDCAQPKNQHRH